MDVGPNGQLIFVDSVSGTNVTTIYVGDIVTWNWKSSGHSVTSALQPNDPLYFDSNVINNGSVFHFQFNTPGTYLYTCVPHEELGMVAKLIVLPVPTVPPDYGITVSPNIATIHAGQSATFTFTVAPSGGFTGAVNFACNTMPAQVTCTFSPATVNVAGASATSTLTVSTTGTNAMLNRPSMGGRSAPTIGLWSTLGLLGILLVGRIQSGKNKGLHLRMLQCLAITLLMLPLAGCAGTEKPSTQLGVSPITVTTSSPTGSISHPAVVYINVVQ